ncbi:MAG: hypothetical protein ACP5QT_02445 [Brevinematia bacterium]
MKWVKISFFMILLALIEIAAGFLMFIFAVKLKNGFVITSLILLLSILIFLVVTRFRERRKLEKADEILRRSLQRFFLILKVTIFILLFLLLCVMIFMLIRGR